MNINVQKNIIENVLSKSQSFLDKNPVDAQSNIKLEAKDGILKCTAFNGEMGIKSVIDTIFVIDDGVAFVNGQKLLSTVKALKNGEISMEVKEDDFIIKQSKSRFKLPMFANIQHIGIPEYESFHKLSLNYNDMIDGLKNVMPSIDNNNPKYELNGALVCIADNEMELVSTDTRRLSYVKINASTDDNLSIIIPKKAISEMQKVIIDDVEVFYTSDSFVVVSDNTTFYTKLINGKYPDFKRVMPSSLNYNLSINKKKLMDALKQVLSVSLEVKVTITSDRIEVESLSTDKNEAVTSFEFSSNIDKDLEFCVNASYVVDFLNTINSEDFTLKFHDSDMPFIVENNDLKMVIMPIIR